MSLEQYKDANRAELWDILQIQVQVLQSEIELTMEFRKYIAELEKEAIKAKNNMVELSKTITEQANTLRELEKENQLLKRVEQIFSDAPDLEFSKFKEMFPDEFEVHNLEQQAKGVDWVLDKLMFYEFDGLNFIAVEDLFREFYDLRNQAASLRGE